MKEKTYNYFYIVNNLLNGHFYLGVHSTDKLADGYFGSGLALKNAIKSYGKENFELTPLKFFKTRKELMDFEREIVNERFLTYYKGICYNLKKGGEGGRETVFTPEEIKEHRRTSNERYNKNNPEKAREQKRNWEKNNPEKVHKSHSNWRKNNPDYFKEWDNEHPGQSSSNNSNWRKNNPEKVREQKNNWRKNNPEKAREIRKRYNAKKKAAKLASQSTPGS